MEGVGIAVNDKTKWVSSKHISVRFDDELAQRLVKAAKQLERRSVSDFLRNLIEWAMPYFEHHGTIADLYKNQPAPAEKQKRRGPARRRS